MKGEIMKLAQTLLVAYLILTTAIIGFAQDYSLNSKNPILVEGNPSLTQSAITRLIDMFEFSLAARVNAAERAALTQQIISQWKSGDQTIIQNYQQLLAIYERLTALDNAKLREAQVQFQDALVNELKKNPGNERNRILIKVYNNAHPQAAINGDYAGGSNSIAMQSTNAGYASGNIPSEIVGTWQTGSASSINYSNSSTGSTINGGGTQVRYKILPDGRYEYAALSTQATYSCSTNLMTYKAGHIEVKGSVLTFVPENGKFTSEDSCNRQYNYEKPAKLDREIYDWSVQRDQYGTKICFQGNGVNGCAYKRD
jgi:hypothetical protein